MPQATLTPAEFMAARQAQQQQQQQPTPPPGTPLAPSAPPAPGTPLTPEEFMRSRRPQPPPDVPTGGLLTVPGVGDRTEQADRDLINSLGGPGGGPGPIYNVPPMTLGGFGTNVLSSTANLVGNVASTLAHPLNTIEGLTQLGLGTVAKVTGPQSYAGRQLEMRRAEIGKPGTNPVDDVLQMLKDRYGSWNAVKQTAYNDPAGMAADISGLVGGAGALSRVTGAASRVAGLSRTGEALNAISRIADPLSRVTDPLHAVTALPLKAGGYAASEGLGILTGAGGRAIRQAYRSPSPEFLSALRGSTTMSDIIDTIRNEVGNLQRQRHAEYNRAFSQLPLRPLNAGGIANAVRDTLNDFGINMRLQPTASGGFTIVPDFSPAGSPLNTIGSPAAQTEIRQVLNHVLGTPVDVGGQATNMRNAMARTPTNAPFPATMDAAHMDALKQRLGSFYSETSEARAFTDRLRSAVRNTLGQIPGYDTVMRRYGEATDFIDELQRELSVKPSAAEGTATRKLQYALNQNNDFRSRLIGALDQATGNRITDMLAGNALSQWAPRGLARSVAGANILWGMAPHVSLIKTMMTSPRVVGEAASAAGRVAPFVRATTRPVIYRPAQYQAGTVTAPPGTPPRPSAAQAAPSPLLPTGAGSPPMMLGHVPAPTVPPPTAPPPSRLNFQPAPPGQQTKLSPEDEAMFQRDFRLNQLPIDPRFDDRGWWLANMKGRTNDEGVLINPVNPRR